MSHASTGGKHAATAVLTPLHAYPRRWFALAIIAVAQLMLVLDATVVNVALPHANQQRVVATYTLTFGGLLLLGGRIAGYRGRKRTFAVASALGGGAWNDTSFSDSYHVRR
ncbi:hypothetical protein [Dactylosporangium sp. CA-233914]|uniref:hypothetical protein n=1 Tax=Dactylosporangium sp. CA-233914 TaxID=3239934 RepID=UPI003D8F5E5E